MKLKLYFGDNLKMGSHKSAPIAARALQCGLRRVTTSNSRIAALFTTAMTQCTNPIYYGDDAMHEFEHCVVAVLYIAVAQSERFYATPLVS